MHRVSMHLPICARSRSRLPPPGWSPGGTPARRECDPRAPRPDRRAPARCSDARGDRVHPRRIAGRARRVCDGRGFRVASGERPVSRRSELRRAAPIPITGGTWSDRSPAWSQDGSRLAFLSDRITAGHQALPASTGRDRQISRGRRSSPCRPHSNTSCIRPSGLHGGPITKGAPRRGAPFVRSSAAVRSRGCGAATVVLLRA
jgi:hypothetical protein